MGVRGALGGAEEMRSRNGEEAGEQDMMTKRLTYKRSAADSITEITGS